ncbi:MAG TPA: penicillin acylase family protein [Burkholderiales bacterium]|nr:penicillin acylase family protein [Burkholderiales bacterium]
MPRLFAWAVALCLSNAAFADSGDPQRLAGLQNPARITIDTEGISHVRAHNDHDLYFMQGWVHAGDRLFQMDYNRRLASGTLAELVGTAALPTDVQLRTLGLRRSAELSYTAASPFFRAALDAYAEGVNARLGVLTPLPPEYGALHLTQVAPWTPVDSIVIAKLLAFSLAFELDIDRTVALQSYIGAFGPSAGSALYSQDLWRSAAFEPNATVPDAKMAPPSFPAGDHGQRGMERAQEGLHSEAHVSLMREYLDRVRDLPAFQGILKHEQRGNSNLWAVSGALTRDGRPLLANDPHLAVATPSVFYPIGLETDGEPVFGSSVAGTPGIIHGFNRWIAWGSTNNLVDVTDVFAEQVVPVPCPVPSPGLPCFATLYKGALEPVTAIPEQFFANVVGSPPGCTHDCLPLVTAGATLVVPRHGPIISLNTTTGAALSVQYVGNGPTQELEAFLLMNRAHNLEDFKAALQRFDVGSQNFVYIDVRGNIAYFTSGEIPVREDLQAGTVNGVPPWFVRNGQGGNEWLPVTHPQPYQASTFEVLPFSELPQIVNPPAGYFVNANNDPSGVTRDNNPLNQLRPGGGISYTAYSWKAGFRVARIEKRLHEYFESGDRRVSFKEMQAIQADVILHDAEVFTPYILGAFDRALTSAEPQLRALAADAGVAEAVGRLRRWDGSTPTGITQGYDAADVAGALQPPSASEVQASVAASIYAAWRSRMLSTVINGSITGLPAPDDFDSLAALRNLLDNFATNGGIGASGVNFFAVPGIAGATDRRDYVILSSLRGGLDMLASAAFFGSANQDDYRWGRLHRIVFAHPLDSAFSIPPAGGAFPPPLPGVIGIPTDGGFQTVDAASHNARGKGPNDFMFTVIPSHRMVAEADHDGTRAADIWPGGTSGVLGSPNYAQFLERWLTNETIDLGLGDEEIASVEKFIPVP